MKFFEKIQKNLKIFWKILSVLVVVETCPSLLEFFWVSGGGTFPRSPLEPLRLIN